MYKLAGSAAKITVSGAKAMKQVSSVFCIRLLFVSFFIIMGMFIMKMNFSYFNVTFAIVLVIYQLNHWLDNRDFLDNQGFMFFLDIMMGEIRITSSNFSQRYHGWLVIIPFNG